MTSIRQLAGCIDVSGNFSVLRNFFGFCQGRLPPDPTGAAVQVSLRRQVDLLRGPHFHLNVIFVGVENFTTNDYIDIDYAIFRMRSIYNQVGVGVGRVQYWQVTVAKAQGADAPTTKEDLEMMTICWSVHNDALDLYIPSLMNVPHNAGQTLGLSPVNGPCDKDRLRMRGAVAGLFGSEKTARVAAHEIGHYLGLPHCDDTTNLMFEITSDANARDSIILTAAQGFFIKFHCFMKEGC